MIVSIRWFLAPLLVVGFLVSGAAASKASSVLPQVRDDAGFFSADAIKKADDIIRDIYDKYDKDLLIETFKAVPDDQADEFKKVKDEKTRNQFFNKWAVRRAEARGVRGVYVLICRHPGHVEVEVAKKTLQDKTFTVDNRNHLARLFLDKFREASKVTGAEQTKSFDAGLIEACEYVRNTFKASGASKSELPPIGGGHSGDIGGQANHGWFSGLGLSGWICPLLLVVLGVWIVIAVVRALTGAGRPQYGPGPGPGMGQGGPGYAPGYGGGGGGGGGFMTGMLGGLFGAAAGSWMYDKWFRGDSGGMGSGMGGGGFGGGSPSGTDGGDTGGYSGTGGDFGDTGGGGGDFGGGGDTGGGGGDFGGGGDTGGGGDFGGGGGDFGGGGDSGGGGDF